MPLKYQHLTQALIQRQIKLQITIVLSPIKCPTREMSEVEADLEVVEVPVQESRPQFLIEEIEGVNCQVPTASLLMIDNFIFFRKFLIPIFHIFLLLG